MTIITNNFVNYRKKASAATGTECARGDFISPLVSVSVQPGSDIVVYYITPERYNREVETTW